MQFGKIQKYGQLIGIFSVLITPVGWAAVEGQGVKLGPGLRLETSAEAKVAYTDNFYRSNTNEQEALSFLLLPGANLSYEQYGGSYRVFYQGELAEHDTRSKDDYFDHLLGFEAKYHPMVRHAFSVNISYLDEHDAIGSSRTSGLVVNQNRELDEWNQYEGEIRYTYGAPSALLNWHLRGLFKGKEYDTNRTDPSNSAAGTRFLDHTANGGGLGVTYTLSPRTKAVLDLEHRDIEYDVASSPSYDGDYQRYLIGVRWSATAKTTGEILIGSYNRNFDSSGRQDSDNLSWKARVRWTPVVQSAISIESGQNIYENYQLGENYIEAEHITLNWRHDWRVRLHSELGVRLEDQEFVGAGRTDDITIFYGDIELEIIPRYMLVFGYQYSDRNSTVTSADYDSNTATISLKASF